MKWVVEAAKVEEEEAEALVVEEAEEAEAWVVEAEASVVEAGVEEEA